MTVAAQLIMKKSMKNYNLKKHPTSRTLAKQTLYGSIELKIITH
jgi:hypothetical protein